VTERWRGLRWVFLGAAVVMLVVFLLSQQQGVDVSYARSPSENNPVEEGSADELTDRTLPSVAEMTDLVDEEPVVRLPGAIAYWDEQRVTTAIGDDDIRILVAPPGLSEKQQEQVRDVENVTIRVMGTEVTGEMYAVSSDDLAGWRGQFATGDVTSLLLTIIAGIQGKPTPEDIDLFTWREPTTAELAAVSADLRRDRLHIADGATVRQLPKSADTAFPDGTPLVAVFPQQPFGQPVPHYGPALAALFPNTPLLVQYGYWIEYHGPYADEFGEVAGGSFYGRFGDRVSLYAYPQGTVLGTYLNRVTDVRYAGLFDRPLPYQPFDPLRVALPVLPWLFGLCVLGFLALSVRSVLGPGVGPPRRPPAQLAGLTTLAIEMSALSHDPALTRGIATLQAARSALDDDLPDRQVRRLLDAAQQELDAAARALGRVDYRPVNYLAGGIS
jgi:hypothetical protein